MRTRTRRICGSPARRCWTLCGPKDPSCAQRRSEPAHHGTSKTAPRHAYTSVRTGRAVIGTRNGSWGLSRPRAGYGSGMFGMGVCESRTRAAERGRTWTRTSGGYCSGIALGRDIWSGSVAELSDDGFGGRSLRILFLEAKFLRALRTEAMLLNRWCCPRPCHSRIMGKYSNAAHGTVVLLRLASCYHNAREPLINLSSTNSFSLHVSSSTSCLFVL